MSCEIGNEHLFVFLKEDILFSNIFKAKFEVYNAVKWIVALYGNSAFAFLCTNPTCDFTFVLMRANTV